MKIPARLLSGLLLSIWPLPAIAKPPAPSRPRATAADFSTLRDQLVDSLRVDLEARPATREDLPVRGVLANAIVQVIQIPAPDLDETEQTGLRIDEWRATTLTYGSKKSADLAIALLRIRTEQTTARRLHREVEDKELGQRIVRKIFEAKASRDLKPLLDELPLPEERPLVLASATGRMPPLPPINPLLTLRDFTYRWQDQLARRESQNPREAIRILREIRAKDYSPWFERQDLERRVDTAIQESRTAAGLLTDEEFQVKLKKIAEQSLAAERPEDIDPLLAEVWQLGSVPVDYTYSIPNSRNLIDFMARLQDLLMAVRDKKSSEIKPLVIRLQSESLNVITGLGIDRSRMVGRINEIQNGAPAPATK